MIKLNAARWGQGLQPQTRSECIAVMNRILNEYGDVVDQHGRKVAALAATTLRQLEFYSIGSKPKDIVGETLDGKQMKLSDYQGRIIVLAFWAKWSTGNGATQEHLEQFSLIADRLKDRGVVVLGVAMDKPDAARKLVKEFKATFPSWVDGGARRISREWNARGHNVYLIDRSGVIRHTNVRASQLEGRVLNLVREAEAADKKQ